MNSSSILRVVVKILTVVDNHLPQLVLVSFEVLMRPAEEAIVDGFLVLRLDTSIVATGLIFLTKCITCGHCAKRGKLPLVYP